MEKLGIQIVLGYKKELDKFKSELNKTNEMSLKNQKTLQARQEAFFTKTEKQKQKAIDSAYGQAIKLENSAIANRLKNEEAYKKSWQKNLKDKEVAEQKAEQAKANQRQTLEQKTNERWQKNLKLQEASEQKRIQTATKLQNDALQKQLDNSRRFAQEYAKTGGVADISTTALGEGSIKSYKMGKDGSFEQVVKSSDGTLTKYKGTIDKTTGSLKLLSAQTSIVNKEVSKQEGIFSRLGNTLLHDAQKVLEWTLATGTIYGTLHKIGDGVEFITKLDTALAEIRMASGLTKEETSGLSKEYNKLAKELGITTEEIASTAVNLYRQGLNTDQVNKKMQEYIKLSKVAGETLEQTIEMGTAGTNTFGVSVERLGDISSATGDAVASSTNEILVAIQKSGSMAATAGVSLEELSAAAAVLGSTTRESGAIVGTSLNIGA